MQINIKHLAKLARLSLTDDEEKMMAEQLPQILDYVGKLQEVDTSKIDAKAYLTDAVNVMRSDEVVATDAAHRRALIDAFPEQAADAMRVPGVFE
ncbi:MAG: Asp-tRNA(Asn)/Glu-tRNA(Gln) amidotransferase subunit GatC [Patescibacteria group bacterium]